MMDQLIDESKPRPRPSLAVASSGAAMAPLRAVAALLVLAAAAGFKDAEMKKCSDLYFCRRRVRAPACSRFPPSPAHFNEA